MTTTEPTDTPWHPDTPPNAMTGRAVFLEQRTVNPADLRPHPRNPNVGDVDEVRGSLRTNAQFRTPVTRLLPDGALQVLAGHTTRLAAIAEGMDLRVDVLECDDATALRVVLADNRTAQLAVMDEERLLDALREADAQPGGLAGTGYDEAFLLRLLDEADGRHDGTNTKSDHYTRAINLPQYEPVGPAPAVGELYDTTRADTLRAQIEEFPGLDPELRAYLMAAAGRHVRFNYRKAAELYPHAPAEVQALMEESALVIIDVDDAIRLGYARLAATLEEIRVLDEADAAGDDGDGD